MNRAYRIVFNRALGVWQVVSELVRGSGKGGTSRAGLRLVVLLPLAMWASLGWAAQPVEHVRADVPDGGGGTGGGSPAASIFANTLPTGGTVSAGSGSIAQSGAAMTITQQTQNLAINWQTFDIGENASVTFLQPNATAIALNRVLGANGSRILGQLKGNGQVWVLNPNGVLFGRTAQVDVGGLVASTLGLSDADFMAGKRSFTGSGGSVINQGSLNGGYVALLGEQVRNEGTIAARLGTAALAAGNKVTLDFNGDQLLNVQVDEGALHALADNRGLIQADGGTVLMTARAKDALLDTAVNNSGVIRARTVEHRDGRILLLGDMDSGSANIAGTLDASAPDSGNGGFIETSAAHVNVADTAVITTKAANGRNGKWLIDPNDFTVAASGGNITGAALTTALAGGDVEIQTATQGTAGGNGDITVNDSISWGANTLTLNAERNIDINARLNGSGSAGLALAYGQGAVAAGNTATYRINAPVNLAATGSFSTRLGSDGSTVDYTLIANLDSIGGQSGSFALINDIDGITASRGDLAGTLEGLGHTVSGIAINDNSTNLGLFETINNSGAVRNLALAGSVASTNNTVNIGLLAGWSDGSIANVHVRGSVTAGSNATYSNGVGGLAGRNTGSIVDASADVTVTGTGSNATGGLVGWVGEYGLGTSGGTIERSHATGAVSGGGVSGGLVGVLGSGSISHSYASGTVTNANTTAAHAIGGLVGNAGAGTAIRYSYATGAVTGNGPNIEVGGLLGMQGMQGTLDNVWASGAVSGGSDRGGLIGKTIGGNTITLSNAHWITDSTGQASAIGYGTSISTPSLSGLTLAQARNAANWTGFNFTATPGDSGWAMIGDTLPMLASEWASGIRNAHQLQLMALKLGGSYALLGDIDASATNGKDVWLGGSFSPVGDATTKFTGSFDGLGHSIGNITINRGGSDNVGLFGYANAASFANVGLTNADILGTAGVGALLGRGDGNNSIVNAWSSGTVKSDSSQTTKNGVGGLAGNMTGSVDNSHSTATVDGYFAVGGLVGTMASSNGAFGEQISNSWASGDVHATYGYAGGLVGASWARITDSHATGNVSGGEAMTNSAQTLQTDLGGLVGYAHGSIYWGTQSANPTQYQNVYATGNVTGSDVATTGKGYGFGFGGLIGATDGVFVVHNAFATGNVSGYSAVGGLIGRTSNSGSGSNSIGSTLTLYSVYTRGGTVTGHNFVGGLIGENFRSIIIYSYVASGAITGDYDSSSNLYQVGAVIGGTDCTCNGSSFDSSTGVLWDYETTGLTNPTGKIQSTGEYLTPVIRWGASSGPDYYVGNNIFWGGNTAQMMTLDPYQNAGWYTGQGGTYTILTPATAAGQVYSDGNRIANQYFIYEGKTYPLLMAFLKQVTLDAAPDYDGSGTMLDNIASVSYSTTGLDAGHLFGNGGTSSGDTLTFTSTQAGSYTVTSNATLGDLYSDQFGYAIAIGNQGVSRVISTPGSVAGEIRLDNGVSWTNGTLRIDTSGTVTAAGAINGGAGSVFRLVNGSWVQNAATLPGFAVNDFQLAGGSFLRAQGGDGSTASPWLLTDAYGLQGMASVALLGKHFALQGDVDASGTAHWNCDAGGADCAGFVPVGAVANKFTGSFDGRNHTIDGLTISRAAENYVGLFGYAGATATLRNISLTRADVTGKNYVAALAGALSAGGLVSDSTTGGTVDGASYIGGLVGSNAGTVEGSGASADVTGSGDYVGGLVGIHTGSLRGSEATGAVSGQSRVGGLVGISTGGIEDSSASGDVSGTNRVGGLVGDAYAAISGSHATGQVTGTGDYVGGLAGYFNGASLSDSYATGDVSGTGNVGGLLGFLYAGTVTNTHATGDVSGADRVGGLVGEAHDVIANSDASGNVTGSNDYIGGLVGATDAAITGSHATGVVQGVNNVGGLTGWTSAATTGSDAQGDVTGTGNNVGGLAGYSSGSITGSHATGAVQGANQVGGLVGLAAAAIIRSYATGAVTGTGTGISGVGGLVGDAHAGANLSLTYATGDVSGAGIAVGGLAGNAYSDIDSSYATGDVRGASGVGGLVGTSSGAISNTYASGAVSGLDPATASYLGGLVGHASYGSILNSYATGAVSGDGIWGSAGGLVGMADQPYVQVQNSFFAITDADGSTINHGGANDGDWYGNGRGTGKTLAELHQLSTFTGAGWNISDVGGDGSIWRIYEGQTGPLLRGFMTQVTVNADLSGAGKTYDGQIASGTAGYTTDVTVNPALLLGLLQYATGSANAGSYGTADGSLQLDGLYSGQLGYDISYGPGSLTIAKALATVIANSGTVTYNGQTRNVTGFTATGLVNGEDETVLDGLTEAGGSGRNAGTYAHTFSGSDNNYELTFVDGALTIDKAAITIGTSDVTKTYDGTLDAAGNAIVLGGQLYDDDAISGGSFAFTDKNAGTGKTVTVGGVTVDDGNGGDNYAITYADNITSTINKAIATVIANSGTVTYNGQTQNASGFTATGLVNGEDETVLADLTETGGSGRNAGSYAHTVGGSDNNYELTFVDGALTIDKAAITIGTGDVTKTYDGTLDAAGNAIVLGGQLFGSDAINGGNFAFTDKNAGTGKTVTVGGVTLDDGNDGGNYAITYVNNTTSTINKAAATIVANSGTVTYNGQTQSIAGFTATGLVNGEDETVLANLAEAGGSGRNAGSYAHTVSGSDNNYELTFVDGALTIDKAAITIGTSDVTKTYDGTLDAAGNAIILGGQLFGSDSLGGGDFAFTDKNAGSNKTVTVSGVALDDGNGGGNYAITYVNNTTSTINKAIATVIANSGTVTYNGQMQNVAGFTATGLVNGEDETVLADLTETGGSGRNAGSYAHTVGGNDNNYELTFLGGTLTIDKAAITIGTSDVTKTYDGTLDAAGNAIVLGGQLFGSDSLGGGDFAFTDKNAGSNKTVTVGGVAVDDGNGGGNYNVTYADNTTSTINKAAATVIANSGTFTYNGQTQSVAGYTVTGLVNGENESVIDALAESGGSGRNAGSYAHTVGGSDNNYDLTFVDGALTIDKAAITIGTSDVTKTYDGTLDAAGNAIVLGGQLFGSDAINGGSFAFTDKNAGSNKTVTVGGVTVDDGNGGGNYDVAYADNTTSTILQKALTVGGSFDADDKPYDGSDSASISRNALALDGVVAGDALSADWRAAFSDAGIGSDKTVTLRGSALSGGDSDNYRLDLAGAPTAVASILGTPIGVDGARYAGATRSAQEQERRRPQAASALPEIAVLQCGQRLPDQLTKDCR